MAADRGAALRALMRERLNSAAEQIFALFDEIVEDYEAEVRRCVDQNLKKKNDKRLKKQKPEQRRLLLEPALSPRVLLYRTECVTKKSLTPETAPEQNQTAPEQNQTAPEQNQTAPEQNQTAPEQNQTAPEQNQTAPELNQMAPEQNQTAPEQNQTHPDQNHTHPDQNQTRKIDVQIQTVMSAERIKVSVKKEPFHQEEETRPLHPKQTRPLEPNQSWFQDQIRTRSSERSSIRRSPRKPKPKIEVWPDVPNFRCRNKARTKKKKELVAQSPRQNPRLDKTVKSKNSLAKVRRSPTQNKSTTSTAVKQNFADSHRNKTPAAKSNSTVRATAPDANVTPSGAQQRKLFVCDQCAASFTEMRRLQRHKSKHLTWRRPKLRELQKPVSGQLYQCKCCPAQFKCKIDFWIHLKTHMPKPFSCSRCPKSYTTSKALEIHQEQHTGSR